MGTALKWLKRYGSHNDVVNSKSGQLPKKGVTWDAA